jgi:hypothetical protein
MTERGHPHRRPRFAQALQSRITSYCDRTARWLYPAHPNSHNRENLAYPPACQEKCLISAVHGPGQYLQDPKSGNVCSHRRIHAFPTYRQHGASRSWASFLLVVLPPIMLVTYLASVALFTRSVLAVGPEVDLGYTTYRGSVENGIAKFRGVRYAAPPLGDRRWRAPAPPLQNANGTVEDATKVCMSCESFDLSAEQVLSVSTQLSGYGCKPS